MVELATKSANGTYGQSERNKVQDELDALLEDIDRVSDGTNFNGTNLLDGNLSKRDATKAMLEVKLEGLHADANKVGVASVKINGKLVEWNVKTVSATKLTEDGNAFKTAITAAGFGADDFTIDYNTAGKVTISAKAEGKNVIKGFKVTGEAAPETAKFTKDAVKNGRGVNKSDVLKLQVGDTNDEFNKISVDVKEMSTFGLGIEDLKISSQEEAGEAIAKIKSAIESVSKTRSDMGALQNRLDHVINNLGVATENMTFAAKHGFDQVLVEGWNIGWED